ncbi:NHLP bacteriocin system secretion protein [Microvirga rosea]|uniref:NHLP bacteriocin system secretion protein n=1 Tax=Microvirga rosea TaxID=2715425 RepID=UPI001D0BDD49|nr:NHLP bacteriocin system secretion protein [Microvirga rosea]MCB8822126.1 NHLP bacteriocin system secretion protein [Microvirga rosea]
MLETKSPPFGVREEPIRDPEQLNRALHLTSPSTWIALAILGLCVVTILGWGILGRLSFYTQGMGIILMQRGVVFDIAATSTGTVNTIHVKVGQQVEKGDLLFTIQQDELAARRQSAAQALKQQQDALATYQASSQADIARRKANLAQQLQSMQSSLKDAQSNLAQLQDIYAGLQQELQRGYTTRPQVQAAFDRMTSVQSSIRDMNDRMASLQTQQIEFEDDVARNVADLQMKVTSAQGSLRDLDVQLEFGGLIRSPSKGFVTEISTQQNAIVSSSSQLAVVETGEEALVVHAYLPISGGKRVLVGMDAQISPTSVERDIYGSLRGRVTSVSALPVTHQGLMNVIGDETLVSQLMAGGAPIEVQLSLESDPNTPSRLKWTSSSGPPVQITPGTTAQAMIRVQRERPISLVIPLAQTWLDL